MTCQCSHPPPPLIPSSPATRRRKSPDRWPRASARSKARDTGRRAEADAATSPGRQSRARARSWAPQSKGGPGPLKVFLKRHGRPQLLARNLSARSTQTRHRGTHHCSSSESRYPAAVTVRAGRSRSCVTGTPGRPRRSNRDGPKVTDPNPSLRRPGDHGDSNPSLPRYYYGVTLPRTAAARARPLGTIHWQKPATGTVTTVTVTAGCLPVP